MNGKQKSAVFQSVMIPYTPQAPEDSRHHKRAKLNDGHHAQELDPGSESPPAFSPQGSDNRHQKTLRSGRTWIPTPLHELEPEWARNRTEVVSSAASASSVSISSPVGQTKDTTPSNKLKEIHAPVKFTAIQPPSNYLGSQNAKVTPRPADKLSTDRFKNTPRANELGKAAIAPRKPNAAQQRCIEEAKVAQRIKHRDKIGHQLMAELLDMGNRSRDVQSVCADRFKWNMEYWLGYFKQTTKVLILGPVSTLSKSEGKKGKKKSLGQMDWSVKCEMDALELCILNSNGDPPTRSSEWLESYASEEFTCVFFHRACVEEIFDEAKSSLYKMTSQRRPRIQFLGAIMIPTLCSLIKSAEQTEQDKIYYRLRDANKINPFLRIFLPRMEAPESHELDKIPIEDSMELLDSFRSMNDSIHLPLEEFVLSTEIGFQLLNETFGKDDMDEDDYFDDVNSEIKEIVKALLVIGKKLRNHFRRFILLVDNSSPLLKKPDHTRFSGIEVMSIEAGCKLAETNEF
ncbi:uncharacterized protein MELLADRAFT_111961 [Melampsora larici-populina 98AG31]|uniref:Uncharacterized protein n=1 Tax=Melampsora larici-populina (strain 98AG31 / pathotype 3-4-7) TaxID=747676 RepID=F4S4X6_MELLP|nr:uncharacterized protein MELLADRAFT_111961 [Melampsora larici-populina 98AG31]EGG00305.1 hypothetical protein MELLADRAFT_111961 [Melampsora larici-populina 98AG31]